MGPAGDAQRQRVLEAASQLFAERGFDDVTMADIAEDGDVSRATVFNYFGSKRAVVEAITESVLDAYRAMLDDALADDTTTVPTLIRRLFDEMASGIESQRRLLRQVFREITRIQLGLDEGGVAQRANEEAAERLHRLVARGQQRGELSDEFDTEMLAIGFHSLLNGTITTWLYHDGSGPLGPRMRMAAEVFLSPVEQSPAQARNPGGPP